jgi:hypothetical protein
MTMVASSMIKFFPASTPNNSAMTKGLLQVDLFLSISSISNIFFKSLLSQKITNLLPSFIGKT